ncbi:hypothetical protein GCM10027047_22590 [Rhodococcus aerolatus]
MGSPVLLAEASRWSPAAARPVTWMFLAMLVTFLLTRLVTRRIRAAGAGGALRDLSLGGVHLHHQVFGVLIMVGTGLALIEGELTGTALRLAAAGFGVGVSLTLDEFALLFYLDDVYWTAEGRASVDAMFCVLVLTGMLVAGFTFGVHADNPRLQLLTLGYHGVGLVAGLVCALRGKLVTAVVGTLLPPVALVGAVRLAKPRSWWARRWYPPARVERARRRFGPAYDARWNRVRDLVAGSPTHPSS